MKPYNDTHIIFLSVILTILPACILGSIVLYEYIKQKIEKKVKISL